MNTASIIVLIIVCIIAAAAVFGIIRSRRKGGCGDCGIFDDCGGCGDCYGCGGCSAGPFQNKKK